MTESTKRDGKERREEGRDIGGGGGGGGAGADSSGAD